MKPLFEWFFLMLAVLGVLVGVGLVAQADDTVTGWLASEHDAVVTIEGVGGVGVLQHFDFDRVVTIGESINISADIGNEGSEPISASFDFFIYDQNGSLVVSYPGPPVQDLGPGAHHGYTIKHTPHKVGSYTVTFDGIIDGTRVRTSRFLFVQDEFTPNFTQPEPRIVTITRRRIRYEFVDPPTTDEPDEPTLTRSWRVDAPQNVSVAQGETTSFPLDITATGQAPVEDITLTLQYPTTLTVEHSPKLMFGIAPNRTQSFLLTITAANGTVEDQEVTYSIRSTRLRENGRITVDVTPSLTIRQLRSEIRRLRLLLVKARNQHDNAAEDGFDVSGVTSLLEEATTALDTAETALDREDVATARDSIQTARTRIDRIFTRLFNLRSQQLIVRAPLIRPIYLLILGAVLIAVLMVGALYYAHEKHNRRPALLRRGEE